MKSEINKINELLLKNGLSKTHFRVALLSFLQKNHGPFTANEIQRKLEKKISFNRTTLFRALKDLTEKKIINKITLLDRSKSYEMAHEHGHHHHIVCKVCGDIRSIKDCNLDKLEDKIRKEVEFQFITHSLEFSGVCSRC